MERLSTLADNAVSPEVKAHIRRLRKLNQQLAHCVGVELAAQCRIANFSATRVLVHVTSPVWHSKLRFLRPAIKEALRHPDGGTFAEVEVKVRPEPTLTAAPLKGPQALSARTAKLLRSAADGISDPRLSATLRRLAKHQ